MFIRFMIGFCVLAVAAAAVGWLGDTDSTTTITATVTSESEPTTQSYDGADPKEAECDVPVRTVPDSNVPVTLANGRQVGTLVLRYSSECQTAWGKIVKVWKQPNINYVAHIRALRPDDQAVAPYRTNDFLLAVYGNMLSTESGCVSAKAWIVHDGIRGPTAETGCYSG